MTRPTDADAAKARAEALFREPHTALAASIPSGAAPRETEAEKIARLRTLRLAREERDRIAAEVRRARRQR